ncbi:MAG TPA: hypothetical protein VMP11_00160 [Verrucomicrobiae bacterium]|nr:hypothetical protein [Verrucomicrobiae bacterium]
MIEAAYDRDIADLLQPHGYRRKRKGLIISSSQSRVSTALSIAFTRKDLLVAQASLCVFVPDVSRLISEAFIEMFGDDVMSRSSDLGSPILVRLLYDIMNRDFGMDRNPFSYSVSTLTGVAEKSKLLAGDFLMAAPPFFSKVGTMRAVMTFIREHPASAGTKRDISFLAAAFVSGDEKCIAEGIARSMANDAAPMSRQFASFIERKLTTNQRPGR